ncbi:hypothetical protein CK1_30060 [Ruminococcus sp. SR1/5]|nr:hypothetical protein CK1_30060 [Ruminococcus sp. SR1/5]
MEAMKDYVAHLDNKKGLPSEELLISIIM